MSGILTPPSIEIKIAGSPIAWENVLDLVLHLGCGDEVSSFELTIDNGDPDYNAGDYYVGGDKEVVQFSTITIKVKRGTITVSTKPLLTGRVEEIDIEDRCADYEFRNVVTIRGRCNGYQLFMRKFDGDLNLLVGQGALAYRRSSGEAESLVAYLIDNYTSLVHSRVNSLLTAEATSGQKDVTVADGTKFVADDLVKIKDDDHWEYNQIDSVAGNVLTMQNNLINVYELTSNAKVDLDLIRATNTSYTKMVFTYEAINDILSFITGTASTVGGIIGYDSRIEYDGLFAFLPKGFLTEAYSPLTGKCQLERYQSSIRQIKNKIWVFGKADKPYPLDVDGQNWSDDWTDRNFPFALWGAFHENAASSQKIVYVGAGTESWLSAGDFVWLIDQSTEGELCEVASVVAELDHVKVTMVSNLAYNYTTANYATLFMVYDLSDGIEEFWCFVPEDTVGDYAIVQESSEVHTGERSVKVTLTTMAVGKIFLLRKDGVNFEEYPTLKVMLNFATTQPTILGIRLRSGACTGNETASKTVTVPQVDQWTEIVVDGGTKNEGSWEVTSAFDWSDVKWIQLTVGYEASGTYVFYIDATHLFGKRWGGGSDNAAVDGFAEDVADSQSKYGIREHSVFNDMLLSDKECEAKAQSLLAFYKDLRTSVEVSSESLDWGDEAFLPGNKVAINFANIGVNDSFRIDSIDFKLSQSDHRPIISFTIDKVPPRMADYLYRLSKQLRQLSRDYSTVR